MEATLTQEQPKSLEQEIKFSWKRVIKNGFKNMKDDVDPVYKGAKVGLYALHAIPTWVRENKDGTLANGSSGWATSSALFVMGTTGLAYYITVKEAVESQGNKGYAALAIPLACQAASYTREAFRRARKSEMNNVIQCRIQKKLTAEPTEQYDLSIKDMVDAYVQHHSRKTESRRRKTHSGIETFCQPDEYTKETTDNISEESKTGISAYNAIGEVSEQIFNELFSHNQVGKKFRLYRDLQMVNKSNENKRKYKHEKDNALESPESFFGKLIWEKIVENKGSANIELLGKVTAIYTGDGNARKVHYQVEPNSIWHK